MNTRMAGAGQTINDRFLAAKHSIAGQGLAKSVCKATTEELMGPKKKHLDYLVHCTNEPNVSIPQMANLLIERSQNTNWIVVYKALVTVHHLMCYGNERFTQYLASNNCTFQLSNFFDRSGVHGYDMSPFIRKYARYLNEKALSYRSVAFDFCKVKRGKEDGILRTMNAEKLLKTLPCLQSQLDVLLEFDCSPNDLANGIINMCFMLLFRDVIRLFACYNDGIINLLEKYFDMNKKQCKEGLDIYKKFLVRMDRVGEFLKVAETVGIDKGDLPDLTKAPSSLLEALEQHLGAFEGKKPTSNTSTPSQTSSIVSQKNLQTAKTTSTNYNTQKTNGHVTAHVNGIDEHLRDRILAEEEAAMNQFKSKVYSSSTNNPFLATSTGNASPMNSALHQVNLLDSEPAIISIGSTTLNKKTSDDLLQLNNPFVDTFSDRLPTVSNTTIYQNNTWIANESSAYSPQPVITNGAFVSDTNFAAVFGSMEPKSYDGLGTVLQPYPQDGQCDIRSLNSASDKPETNQRQQSSGALLTGDLETSLASLAENLTIRSPTVKTVQWNSPNVSKPSWTPQPLAATTGAGYKPMNQTMTSPPPMIMQQSVYQPQIQPTMGLRPLITNTPMYTQKTGMLVVTPTSPIMNPMGQQQQLLFN